MRKKFFSLLVLLAAVATGAMAQTETLLTTITATGIEQANYSTEGVATVSFSCAAGGNSSYHALWGWWGYGITLTVTPAEGYTITKCVFYDDANRTATDSEAPFVVETTEEDKTPQVNGTPILAYTSKGIKKIDVYGYENPTTVSVTGITLSQTEAAMTVGGETLTLTATVNPNNATDQRVSWSTSDANVATVENGVVTAVAAGNATITVTTTDGYFTATCAITVTAPEPTATVVTITNNDFPEMDVTFTKDGVTVWADWIDNMSSGNLVGPGSFSTTLGNFTKIEVNAGEVLALGEGWSGNSERQTWTGNASSVSFSGEIYGVGVGITLKFTIESQGGETAVENVQTNPVQATKFFRDGQLLIEKNGKIYNATGAEVK